MTKADQDVDDLPETDVDDPNGEAEERPPLNLEVKTEERSACERHLTVTVNREDVDRYLKEKIDELMPEAEVPGFRPGRAPRKIVESKFKKQLKDQVKGALLLDAMTQVTDADGFSAISEPDFDFDSVEIPDDGPFTFEFDIEVRPEFDLPDWKGLKIDRPTREYSDEDVDRQIRESYDQDKSLLPYDGAAEKEDYVVVTITSQSEGKEIAQSDEETVCVRNKLTFPDATMEGFSDLIAGASAGDKKTATVKIAEGASESEYAGKEIDVEFEVLDVKRLEPLEEALPRLVEDTGIESLDEMRNIVRDQLSRRLTYEQNKRVREQVTSLLTESADWSLPPELLKRQSSRELHRAVLELRSSGFPEEMIRAYENDLRQNSERRTEQALKEHFILERIAEELEIEADDADYETELQLIAEQQNDSVRRIRAKLEKQGNMDALRNQIIERRVIDQILEHAEFNDVSFEDESTDTSAVDFYLSGSAKPSEIPEAKYDNDASENLGKPAS